MCGAEYLAGTVYGNNPQTGEPLDPSQYGGACNLGSIMLHNFVVDPFTRSAYLDYDRLHNAIRIGVRFLDDIIDVNKFPDQIYENYQKSFRTIGLGITGLADMLVMLGYKYSSNRARDFVSSLMNDIAKTAYRTSIELSKEKRAFPFFRKDEFIKSGYLQRHKKIDPEWETIIDDIYKYGIRNAKILSVAPTGTMSLAFGNNCSSGIEPIFSLEYTRKIKLGGQSDDCIKTVKMRDCAYDSWTKVPNSENCITKDMFVTAMEMSVDNHVDMLACVAQHVDMSCSKTINVPSDYSFDDTKNIFTKAWRLGIKGCTIFRPNEIREGVLIADDNKSNDSESKTQDKESYSFDCIKPVSRKSLGVTHGNTYCKKTACGTLYITVNCDDQNNLVECFVHTSKGGICQANINAVNRMASLCLRSGVQVDEIIDQLQGITCQACGRTMATGTALDGVSCPDIIARTIRQFKNDSENANQKSCNIPQEKFEKDEPVKKYRPDELCPECGAPLRREGGCMICVGDDTHTGCGYSRCD